jgi:hypothetical protein
VDGAGLLLGRAVEGETLESIGTLPTPETDFRETVSLAAAGVEAPKLLLSHARTFRRR